MECFGQHAGGKQQANLGDGHGWVDQRVRYSLSFVSPSHRIDIPYRKSSGSTSDFLC